MTTPMRPYNFSAGPAVMPDEVVPEDEAVAHAVASLAGCAR